MVSSCHHDFHFEQLPHPQRGGGLNLLLRHTPRRGLAKVFPHHNGVAYLVHDALDLLGSSDNDLVDGLQVEKRVNPGDRQVHISENKLNEASFDQTSVAFRFACSRSTQHTRQIVLAEM